MGRAGGQFVKAWLRVNEEEVLGYLEGEEGEIFDSHATPYVGNLQGY